MRALGWIVMLVAVAASAAPVPMEQGQSPPPRYAAYFNAVRNADAIEDPERRCLAYPDLPGNVWGRGAGKARCALLRFPEWTFGDVRARVDAPARIKELDAA